LGVGQKLIAEEGMPFPFLKRRSGAVLAGVVSIYMMALSANAHADDLMDACQQPFDLEKSIRACTSIIKSAKSDKRHLAMAYSARGSRYMAKGSFDKALKDLDKAVAYDKDYMVSYYFRGLVHRFKGNRKKAIADFKTFMKMSSIIAKVPAVAKMRSQVQNELRELGVR
jgi:tetratricopeptide (TPR) repeat protein